jgi:hypothetical protein
MGYASPCKEVRHSAKYPGENPIELIEGCHES